MAGAVSAESMTETEFVECGLCYENDELKRLPCSPGHIFCVTCLTRDSAETQIILCPFCKQVTESGVDALPSANSPLDEFRCCDVCRRKDDKNKLAQTYCVDCKKRFCKPHQESHSDTMDDHKMIPMSEYLKEYRKMETRYCSEHADQVYSLACKKCYGVFCMKCSPWESYCKDGTPHQATELEDFVYRLINKIAERKVWIFDKEETILGIVKELTRVISDWDSDTEEMIQLIHQARDKQIEELTAKYEALEKRLTEMRRNAMAEVSQYLDGDIGTKLNKLTREIRRLDTRIFINHKVDVISGYKETERLCDELMQMKVPVYKPSENHVTVSITDKEACEINAEIIQWTGSLVTSEATPLPLPSSLKLLRKVNISSMRGSVVHHKQFTYVGLNNTVVRFADDTDKTEKFVHSFYEPMGLVVHNDLLYVLGSPLVNFQLPCISVYDFTGALLTQWDHGSIDDSKYNNMCIVGDQIVVSNISKKCLTVYSLTGHLIREISCENISNDIVCMTTAPNNSVIVSDSESSCVFRVDIETGNVMWTSKHVSDPQGVTCYGELYVLVTKRNNDSRIWILDGESGEYLGDMVGEPSNVSNAGHITYHKDLHISGDTIIVSRYHENMIYYYQII